MQTIDLGQGTPEFIAPEDMQIMNAVVQNLYQHSKVFRINFQGGAYLTNIEGGPVFSFSGIDQIQEASKKLADMAEGVLFVLIMPTDSFQERTRIGELFGMEVFADPKCDKNNFVIQEKPLDK